MTTPATIAFLMNGAKPPRGGEILTLSLAKKICRERFNPVVIYFEESFVVMQLREAGLRMHRLVLDRTLTTIYPREIKFYKPGLMGGFLYRFLRSGCTTRLKTLLEELHIDLIYCSDNLSKLVAGMAVRGAGVKVVGHCYEVLERNPLGCALFLINTFFLNKIIAISEVVRKSFPTWQTAKSKIVTIHNAVDTQRFDPNKVGVPSDQSLLKPEGIEVMIGMIGTLDRNKGHSDLFEAVNLLDATEREILKLVIAGSGPEEQTLKLQCRGLGLESKTRFLGFCHDIPQVLGAVGILVVCSRNYESCATVILEAMSMAIPVIATAVGGNPELVVDGETGLLVPPGDPKALKEALRYLIQDPPLRLKMGQRGRQRVLEQFSLEKIVPDVEKVFEELLN